MADDIPTPGKGVYLFFEFVALGFVLEAVADIVHYHGPWYRWSASFVLAAFFLGIGIKGPNIKAALVSRIRWLRTSKALAAALKENAELKARLGQSQPMSGVAVMSQSPASESRTAAALVPHQPSHAIGKAMEAIKEPSLSSLMKADFSTLMKLHGKPTLAIDGEAVEFEDILYADFGAGAKFPGFLIPSCPMAMQVALFVAEHAIKLGDALGSSLQIISKLPGEHPQDLAKLKYTGKVFLYHQDFFSHRERGEIEEAFKKQNLEVVLRGPDYLTQAWLNWKRSSEPQASTNAIAKYQWPIFTVQRVTVDPPSTDPSIVYKNKIRIILTNSTGKGIDVWRPLWDSEDVRTQFPFGSLISREGPRGWKAGDWEREGWDTTKRKERMSTTIEVGVTMECWVGLEPPSGQSIERRLQTHTPIGRATFPVRIEDKIYLESVDL